MQSDLRSNNKIYRIIELRQFTEWTVLPEVGGTGFAGHQAEHRFHFSDDRTWEVSLGRKICSQRIRRGG